jgi:hypothetical protein
MTRPRTPSDDRSSAASSTNTNALPETLVHRQPTIGTPQGAAGSDSIWFSAGINDEQDGLIGVLRAP